MRGGGHGLRLKPKRGYGAMAAKLPTAELADCYAGFCAAAKAVWGREIGKFLC